MEVSLVCEGVDWQTGFLNCLPGLTGGRSIAAIHVARIQNVGLVAGVGEVLCTAIWSDGRWAASKELRLNRRDMDNGSDGILMELIDNLQRTCGPGSVALAPLPQAPCLG